MRVSEHFAMVHKARAAENRAGAKHERTLAKNARTAAANLKDLNKAAKAKEMDDAPEMTLPSTLVDYLNAQEEQHEAQAANFDDQASECDSMVEECMKAAEAESLAKADMIIPDRVSAMYPAVRAIPRTGQRPINKSGQPIEDESEIDPQFERLVKLD